MKRLITGLTVVLFSATCAAADVKLTELEDSWHSESHPQ
jgi:hypothetical protein